MHFKLERTSCKQSLKYVNLYNTEAAPFSQLRKETSFCVRKIRNHYTEFYSVVIASPAEAVEILKFGFSKMHILCILREM